MDRNDYSRELLAINSANLAANLENVSLSEQIIRRNMDTTARIIMLLELILKEVQNDSKRGL